MGCFKNYILEKHVGMAITFGESELKTLPLSLIVLDFLILCQLKHVEERRDSKGFENRGRDDYFGVE